MNAIEKLRNVVNWANWQNEGFNERFKSISDIEKAYDYCQNSNLVEFLDYETLMTLTNDELKTVRSEVNTLMGYDLI